MYVDQYINIYLDKKTAILLEKTLKETGENRSKFVREALNEKFQRMGIVEK